VWGSDVEGPPRGEPAQLQMAAMLMTLAWVVLVLLTVAVAVTVAAASPLQIDVKVDSAGRFSIIVDRVEWFRSGDVFIYSNGVQYSQHALTLSSGNVRSVIGEDNMGVFDETFIDFSDSADALKVLMIGSIRKYHDGSNVVFRQYFPNTLQSTSSGDPDGLISSFPSFEMFEGNGVAAGSRDAGLGYAHWISWFYDQQPTSKSLRSNFRRRALVAPGFSTPQHGTWDTDTRLSGGIGGSGVTAVYALNANVESADAMVEAAALGKVRSNSNVAVIIAPLTNMMAVSHVSPASGTLAYGIMGNVSSVPEGYSVSVLMHFGSQGVNQAMSTWGKVFRGWYNKADANAAREKDITLQYLGFSTDNGAYYYYNTVPGKDYEQTLLDVKADADMNQIPYKYVLLDSWWYYKGANGGVSEWAAR
jgi:hypothetical protein